MNHRTLALAPLAALMLAAALPSARAADAPAAAAPASGASASSPAKKALVAKVIALQQPGIESMARQLAEQPAMQVLQQAGMAMQRVPADKRDALIKDIQGDIRRYADEATPIVRDQAVKIAPQTIGPLLEKEFTEDELKQIVAILESPVNKKLQGLVGQIQRMAGGTTGNPSWSWRIPGTADLPPWDGAYRP